MSIGFNLLFQSVFLPQQTCRSTHTTESLNFTIWLSRTGSSSISLLTTAFYIITGQCFIRRCIQGLWPADLFCLSCLSKQSTISTYAQHLKIGRPSRVVAPFLHNFMTLGVGMFPTLLSASVYHMAGKLTRALSCNAEGPMSSLRKG